MLVPPSASSAVGRWLMLVVLLLTACAPMQRPPEPSCENPRSAADSMLVWLHPSSYDQERASTCLDAPPGANVEALAVQLKQVLDARGLWVPVTDLSEDPDFADELGRHRVVPLPGFPDLVLERAEDGRWLYSRSTLEHVPALYEQTFSPLALRLQSQLPNIFLTPLVAGVQAWQVLYALLLGVSAWAVGQIVRLLLRDRIHRLVRNSKLSLDAETYQRTNRPLVILAGAMVFSWGIPDLQLPVRLSQGLLVTSWLVVELAAILFAARFLDVLLEMGRSWAQTTESRLDDQLIPLLHQGAIWTLWAAGVLVVLDAAGVDVWKLAAGVGIGGLAFALAAKDSISNFFGSVNIFVDRPFQIGDWVVISGVEGVVEEVGFRSTRVRTFYNSQVTIPNSQITNAGVDNMGRRPRRRVKMTLGITYDTPPDLAQAYVEGVRAILAAHPAVEPTYEVHLYELGDSALQILVYYHLVVPGWHEELVARSQNLLEFMRLAETMGVSFAFPSSSLYLESTPERPLAGREVPGPEALQALVDGFGPGGATARPDGPPMKGWSVQDRG